MTYVAAFFGWLGELIKPFLPEAAAFLTAWRLKGLEYAEKRATERADALEARVAEQNRVASLPNGAATDELRLDWSRDDPRNKVRGNGTSRNIQ